MQVSKLKFSSEELEVLQNIEFFMVKHRVSKGLVALFGDLCDSLENIEKNNPFPFQGLNAKSGKIFRGENYRLLPYFVLDYPRLFSKESILAFRTMYWWGNEFSFTIHLQGTALELLRPLLMKNIHTLKGKEFYICIHPDSPWEYHFGSDNYMLLDQWLNKHNPDALEQFRFVKISRRLTTIRYEEMGDYGKETWSMLKEVLI